jgi:HEAT repeat protein
MKSGKSTEDWIRELIDERAPTRCTAAYELGKIGDCLAVDHLTLTLKDAYLSVRYYSAESLGNIGHRRAIPPLIKALTNKDQNFRTIIKDALKKITRLLFSSSDEWRDWFRKTKPSPEKDENERRNFFPSHESPSR